MAKNKDEIMSHSYDGIQEYDNPMPMWWILVFIMTTIFAFVYVFGITFGQIDGYMEDMKQAKAEIDILRQAELAANPPIDSALLMEKLKDTATATAGAGVFATNCASCHGDAAQGSIGPNLTDNAYLFGKEPMEVHKIIKDGTANGMPPWGDILSRDEMVSVIAYVVSVRGSKPADPKDPEGKVIE